MSLLPLGHWILSSGEPSTSPHALSSAWWKFKTEYYSFACILFLFVKSYSRSRGFHHERSSVNRREAFWKKLLSIINTITYNKRHNLTSPHPTKRIHLKLQELQLEGQSSSECVLQAGEYRQGTVLTALSLGTLLCMMEHTSLSASQPLPHPPPKDPTVLLITDRVQNIGLCLPLTLSQILHRQHWKNSSF